MNTHTDAAAEPTITFIANPYSIHVAVWLKAAKESGLSVRIETADPEQDQRPDGTNVDSLAPRWLKRPAILRYLWAGLKLRNRRLKDNEILHAHCASGNGLTALLSGHPYIVTTYGGEVLDAPHRGWYYYWTIHRVLQRAERITATSPQMVDVLTNDHGIPRDRIHLFDLGLDTQTFHPVGQREQCQLRQDLGIDSDEPVWISVKRAIPMNRTVEILQAFLAWRETSKHGTLVVICGEDIVDGYAARVKAIAAASPHSDSIIILDRWLDPPEVARWLQVADFAIAAPEFDQMSNAVLEAMACGTIPVLLNIDGYRSLRERGAQVHWLGDIDDRTLLSAFDQMAAMPLTQRQSQQQASVDFIRQHYGNRKVGEVLARLYNPSSNSDEMARRAA